MALTILYRGALASCNYACGYCPFAKRKESAEEIDRDRAALERFVGWVAGRDAETSVLFTPWGEALVRGFYREALAELSHMPHVRRVAIQTNLHAPLGFVARADRTTLAFWCTYHPDQTTRTSFLARCAELDAHGVRYSVGIVGLREHLEEAEALRAALRPDVYVWVNAYKRHADYYRPEEIAKLLSVDPLFSYNAVRHPSRGRLCRTGATVIAVDGDGDVRRCHFVPEVLGNLYEGTFAPSEGPSPCPNATCGCHIGYVHLEALGLDRVFGDGVLERVPAVAPESERRLREQPV